MHPIRKAVPNHQLEIKPTLRHHLFRGVGYGLLLVLLLQLVSVYRGQNNQLSIAAASGTTIIFVDSGQALGSSNSRSVALGDIDRDGDLDALVVNHANQPNIIWLNDGTGHFTAQPLAVAGQYSLGVALGNLNGDTNLDAYFANGYGQNIDRSDQVWLSDNSGQLIDSGQRLGSADSWDVALGRLDNDEDMDVFVARGGTINYQVLLNDGAGQLSDHQQLGNANRNGVALGDLDGDTDLDAWLTHYDTPNQVWLNDGNGTFTNNGQSLVGYHSRAVALGDVDNDGDLDAVVANEDEFQPNQLWLNDGTGQFSDSGQSPGTSRSRHVALGDLDGDQDLDLVIINDNRANELWLNDGAGHFSDSNQQLGTGAGRRVALGDLDKDQDIDAFIVNDDGQPNRVWFNSTQSLTTTLRLGVNMHPLASFYYPTQIARQVQLARNTGVEIIRIDIHWSWIEGGATKPAQWNAEKVGHLEEFLAAAQAYQLDVLAVVTGTPCWAADNLAADCSRESTYENYPPQNPQDYFNFIDQLVARHGHQIRYWQIWNEPNIVQPPLPATVYSQLLQGAYATIKARDPGATVIGGSLAPVNDPGITHTLTYLDDMYRGGAKGHFDALSFHPYTSGHPPTYIDGAAAYPMFRYTISIPTVRSKMLEYGDTSPLWLTEIGWSTGPLPRELCANCDGLADRLIRSQADQASFLTEAATLIDANGWSYVAALIWYELVDCDLTSDKCDASSYHSYRGLYDHIFRPKEAVSALQSLTGAKPVVEERVYLPLIIKTQ